MTATLPSPLWSEIWQDMAIRVFSCGEDADVCLDGSRELLTPEELERAGRFRFERDRSRWIRSRALLRLELSLRTGIPPREIALEFGSFGKPGIAGCEFNLSHSGDFAVMASGGKPVGVDLEVMRSDLPFVPLAEHSFRPDEAAAIIASANPALLFYQLWTAKESVMKCTGQGMNLLPAAIAVEFCGDGPVAAVISDTGERFRLFSRIIRGASLTVAVPA